MLHCSIRANIRPVQSAIWRSWSCCWVTHTQRDVGIDFVLAVCIGIMKSIFFKRKTAKEQNWSKLAALWTCIDMICYDVLWCAMICDMISSVRSIDLWNFGGLSFWAGGQCGKNSPDNLDFHAESLWQQSSCHQDRAQQVQDVHRPFWHVEGRIRMLMTQRNDGYK